MKKLLSIILTLTFCLAAFSALAPTVAAKSGTISESEVNELVVKARDLMMVRYGYYDQKYFDHESYERRTVHLSEYNIDVTYRPVLESALPGGSYAAVCELANEISLSVARKLPANSSADKYPWKIVFSMSYGSEAIVP